jgi:2-polyprenyl-3-methyl-5-hydroxy-6-metoxy-1,4-benzoquinol methylase
MPVSDSRRLADFFDRKAASFDAVYSGQKPLPQRIWDRLTRRNILHRLEFALEALAPLAGKRILDAGCGSGRFSVAMAARGAEVVGIDLSQSMLELAEALAAENAAASRCRFIQTDLIRHTDGRCFDATVAMGFFDYVLDPLPVLKHLRTMTRGALVASFPARYAFRAPFRKAWLTLHNCPLRFYTRETVARLCLEAGLNCRVLVRSGPIYLLTADVAGGP